MFLPADDAPETVIALDEAERDLKRRMMAAHVSQAEILGRMSLEAERFRPAPPHDFTRSPADGPLLYESFGWGITGERWRNLAGAALAAAQARRGAMTLTVLSVAYPLAPVGPDAVGGAEQILRAIDRALVRGRPPLDRGRRARIRRSPAPSCRCR